MSDYPTPLGGTCSARFESVRGGRKGGEEEKGSGVEWHVIFANHLRARVL